MIKKTILSIAAFLFIAGAYAQTEKAATPAAGTVAPAANPNAAEFKFDVEVYDFGTIKQGESVSYKFNFTNTGKDPLIITEAHGSCGCTVPQWPKDPITKGGKGTIDVTFNSTGKSGMQDKTVTITSNAGGGAKVLHVKGNVEVPPAAPAKTEPAAK